MSDARAFQQVFGALMLGDDEPRDPATRRAISIHRNTAANAALDALAANYSVVGAMVGEPAFLACGSAFVAAAPPTDPRLCLYGVAFPAFLDAWTPFAQLSYLRSVAMVERFVTEALFAGDAPLLDPTRLARGIEPNAPLLLHPATRFGSFECPAGGIWRAHLEEASPDALETLDWKGEAVLVTRPQLAVEVRTVDAATLSFLSAPTIAEAAVAASAAGGDIVEIFSLLLNAGAFAASVRPGASQ